MRKKYTSVGDYIYFGATFAFIFFGFIGVAVRNPQYIWWAFTGCILGGLGGFALWKKNEKRQSAAA